MHTHPQDPVFIFLPVTREQHGPDDRDPVCGRLLADVASVGRLAYDGRDYHFCSLRCAERFAACPTEFGTG